MSRDRKPHKSAKKEKKPFFCPLGNGIMWHHGLEYSDCPLGPSHRDMPECKECKLRIDKKWESNKETWEDKPAKPKRKRKWRKNKQGAKK